MSSIYIVPVLSTRDLLVRKSKVQVLMKYLGKGDGIQ
jgi:hypothetical protein